MKVSIFVIFVLVSVVLFFFDFKEFVLVIIIMEWLVVLFLVNKFVYEKVVLFVYDVLLVIGSFGMFFVFLIYFILKNFELIFCL